MNKKFNIKKFVKISAVALAMISAGVFASTINANTNVHAESIQQKEDASDLESAKEDSIQAKHDEDYAAYRAAKSDPSILAYDLTYARNRIKGHEQELINDLTPSQKVTLKKDVAKENGAPDPAFKKVYNHLTKIDNEKLFGTSSSNSNNNKSTSSEKTTVKPAVSNQRHTHLSKAMVRKIMKQIRSDKAIVRNDKKQLSSRKVRKAYKKYKKTGKKTFYVRRYMFFHNDKAEYESKLDHLIKSVHTSKTTKRSSRKALTKVRESHNYKNRKNAKRNHKRITKHNRNHKHMKYNARRTHKNRK